jgi:hypothetical protein
MIPHIRAAPSPVRIQTALPDSEVSSVRLVTALVYSDVWPCALPCFFPRTFSHYGYILGCICTPWLMKLKWRSDNSAPFFRPSWGLPCYRRARAQGSMNRGRTADGGSWLESRSVLFYLPEKNPPLTIEPHSRSGRGGEEGNPIHCLVSHCTPKNSHICISAGSICLCYFKDRSILLSVDTSFKIKLINGS